MRNLLVGRFLYFCLLTWFSFQANAQQLHWGYRKDNGPATWPGACAFGSHQSPVNILDHEVDIVNVEEIFFGNYEGGETVQLWNDGHTVKVKGFEEWKKRPYILGGLLKAKYNLLQIHLHWGNNNSIGSEHQINSNSYPVEVHFVHEKEGDKGGHSVNSLAVVAVFLQIGMTGDSFLYNEDLLKQVATYNTVVPLTNFLPSKLLSPDLQTFYIYNGSLTTPGCDEIVRWMVFPEPASITNSQLQLLRNIQADDGKIYDECNCRPTYPLNDRHILYRRPSFWDNFTGYTVTWIIVVFVIVVFVIAIGYCWQKNKQKRKGGQVLPNEEEIVGLLDHQL